jgi:hypothetical protein
MVCACLGISGGQTFKFEKMIDSAAILKAVMESQKRSNSKKFNNKHGEDTNGRHNISQRFYCQWIHKLEGMWDNSSVISCILKCYASEDKKKQSNT